MARARRARRSTPGPPGGRAQFHRCSSPKLPPYVLANIPARRCQLTLRITVGYSRPLRNTCGASAWRLHAMAVSLSYRPPIAISAPRAPQVLHSDRPAAQPHRPRSDMRRAWHPAPNPARAPSLPSQACRSHAAIVPPAPHIGDAVRQSYVGVGPLRSPGRTARSSLLRAPKPGTCQN